MPNEWKWRAKDGSGKHIEAAPGQPFFLSRGPTTKASMKHAADILLYNKRVAAVNEGLNDPGYVVDEDSIEPVGNTDQASLPLGFGKPGAKAISLPTDPAVNAAREARLAKEA